MSFRICIDIGGTFTDLTVIDESGGVNVFKSPTTPDDYIDGMINALELAREHYGIPTRKFMVECSSANGGYFAHASTISTNAIIKGTVSKTGLLCTKGFRDTLTIREGGKDEPYNLQLDYPEPYVPRYLSLPITERINSEGGVEVALDESEVRQALRQLKEWEVKAIAVSLLWSISNPVHELRISEIIKDEWPEVPHVLGHQLNPCIREYRRTSSAVINASLLPLFSKYVSNLNDRLKNVGYSGELLMLTSNGGVMSVEAFVKSPIYSIDSGPAMTPVAGKLLAARELGRDDVITVDMGGTSFDVSCVTKGDIPISREAIVASHMLGINKVDSRSIGAGGGSIGWVDSGGLLHVGPQSAEAVPGPACYGQGGQEATVTDANLALGYLNPDYFLGGAMKLNRRLAEQSILQKVCNPLNLELTEAAFSIWNTVNINMVGAIKDITVWQGIDPRGYLFVSGGGAAGVHIVPIMQELEAKTALVPKVAGSLSAFGGVFADLSFEFSASYCTKSTNFDYKKVNETLERLEKRADAGLQKAGIEPKDRRLEFYVEAHYPYQIWELSVPLRGKRVGSEKALSELVDDFHEVHERVYAIKEPAQPIECIYWRVRAIGVRPHPAMKDIPFAGEDASAALVGKRKAYFRDLGGMVDTPIYRGEKLLPGNKITAPAIIEEPTTTIIVFPNSEGTVTKLRNYILVLD
jgi:N-methylhydantoinase A